MIISDLASIIIFLCWGSFLNVIAYRLIFSDHFWALRSYCPHCKKTIAWYDNIPVISWLLLHGTCRYCHNTISYLYPLIELFTALVFYALIHTVNPHHWFGYAIFFSALIITIRTDLETMLISREITLWLVPVGALCSMLHLIPLSILDSVIGAASAYLFLYCLAVLYRAIAKRDGMGLGDIDLLALIGSFLGLQGWWISLLIASLTGTIIGVLYLASKQLSKSTPIPFGPFLAFGALVYALNGPLIMPLMSSMNLIVHP